MGCFGNSDYVQLSNGWQLSKGRCIYLTVIHLDKKCRLHRRRSYFIEWGFLCWGEQKWNPLFFLFFFSFSGVHALYEVWSLLNFNVVIGSSRHGLLLFHLCFNRIFTNALLTVNERSNSSKIDFFERMAPVSSRWLSNANYKKIMQKHVCNNLCIIYTTASGNNNRISNSIHRLSNIVCWVIVVIILNKY